MHLSKCSTGAFFFDIMSSLSKLGGKMTKMFSSRKIKAAALVCSLFFSANSFSFAQKSAENSSQNQNTEVSQNQNSSSSSLSQNDSSSNQNNQSQTPYWSVSSTENQVSSPSTFGLFLRMVISLLIVIGLVYLVVRIFKKNTGMADTDDSFLRRVAVLSIGSGKSVQIVTLLENAYLIGVTDNNINLISEIKDKELVDSLNLLADKNQNTGKPKSFSEVLDIFLKGTKNKNAFSDDAKKAGDILKNQRDRFNRGE